MIAKEDRKFFIVTLLIFLALLGLPYLLAAQGAGPEHVFTGLLVNPLDGNSYLAKMREGWRGEWLFTLPYIFETSATVPFHLPYILLGHVACVLGLALVPVFHVARLAAAAFLLWALYSFMAALFPPGAGRRWAFLLASFGSGLGWLAVAGGGFTPDFWVGEAYPFLASYSNVHFPLGLGLQLLLLTPGDGVPDARRLGGVALLALCLALVSAFSVPVVGVVLGGVWLLDIAQKRPARAAFWQAAAVTLGGAPLLLYDLWAIGRDPLLMGWNAQNITALPPLWELLVAFSPALLLAAPGVWFALRRAAQNWRVVAVWAVVCPLLAAIPFALQRRFLVGYFIPLAALVVFALGAWLSEKGAGRARLALFLLALPTNLILLLTAIFAARTLAPELYLTRGEHAAYAWIEANTPAGARLLAGPDTGLFIPAYTDARVYYGHPFESLDAAQREAELLAFYAAPDAAFVHALDVEYLYYGPREAALGPLPDLPGLSLLYDELGVKIYAVSTP
ncbi:MAG: hypothetical protein EPO32_11760 [Anaerolineae bacterium]|nr:MAG: hypothetical protein EPO32_11760 [Anaerolineae bacterium]